MRIVVLTSIRDIVDVNLAYRLGAHAVLVKPLDFEHFDLLSQTLQEHGISTGSGLEGPPLHPEIQLQP